MARSLKKNFAYNSAYQVFQIITPLVTTPYLSRVLGASGVGDYSYTFAVAGYFFMFAMMGISQYGVRAVASVGENREKRTRIFWSAYVSQLLIGVIVLVAYAFYIVFCPADTSFLALLWTGYVLSALINITWLFFGVEDFGRVTAFSFAIKTIELIGIFVLVRTQDDLWLYVCLDSLCFFLNQLVLWPFIRHFVGFYRPSWREVCVHFKPNMVLFIPVVAVSLYTTLNTVLLGILSTSVQTGYYSYAEKLSKMPLAVITAMGTVMLPRMSNALALGNREEGLKLIESSMWFMLTMAFALSFGIVGVAEEFVPVFLGDEFTPAIPSMILLPWIIPLICVTNVIGVQYLLPSNRDRQYTISVCVGAAINIVLCVLLIPQFGAIGSAVGTVVAEAAVLIVQAAFVRFELPLFTYAKSALPFVLIGTAMAVVLRIMSIPLRAALGVSVPTLLIEILAGMLIYCVATLIFCLVTNNNHFKELFGSRLHKLKGGEGNG